MLHSPMDRGRHLLGAQLGDRSRGLRLPPAVHDDERRRYGLSRRHQLDTHGVASFDDTAYAAANIFCTGEEASAIIEKLRGKMQGVIDLQSEMDDWKKFVEVFCVQNAFGAR